MWQTFYVIIRLTTFFYRKTIGSYIEELLCEVVGQLYMNKKASVFQTQNLKWCLCPTKRRESSLRQTLQVRVTSDTQKIQSSDWPKWRTLWRNVNSRILSGIGRHFNRSVNTLIDARVAIMLLVSPGQRWCARYGTSSWRWTSWRGSVWTSSGTAEWRGRPPTTATCVRWETVVTVAYLWDQGSMHW